MIDTMIMLIIDCISQVLFQVVFYSGMLCLINTGDVVSLKGIVFIIPFCILITIIRRYCDKLWRFLLAILMICVVGIVLNQILLADAVVSFILLFITFLGFIIRIKASAKIFEHPDAVPFSVMAIIYVIMEFAGYTQARQIVFISVFLYILLFLLDRNIQRIQEYIERRRQTTIMAEAKMKKVFCSQLALYITGLALIIILFTAISFRGVYESIVSYQLEITDMKGEANPNEFGQEDIGVNFGEIAGIDEDKGEPSVIFIILEKIMSIIMCILLVAALAVSLFIILRVIYNGFYGRRNNKEKEVLFASVETREYIKKRKSKKKDSEKVKDLRKLLRKLYRKQMAGFWKDTGRSPEVTTPSEQRNLKNAKGEEVSEEVVELYERARYSNHDITKEDIIRMQKTIKK